MRAPHPYKLAILALFTPLLVESRGASLEEKVELLYRPFQAEQVTLSPDGRNVAYTQHAKGKLFVVVQQVDNPTAKASFVVDEDREVLFSKEKERARLSYLRWNSATRLVMAPAEENLGRGKISSPIIAVNADGTNPKTLAENSDFSVTIDITPPIALPRPGEAMLAAPVVGPPITVTVNRHIHVLGRVPGDPDHVFVEALPAPPLKKFVGPVPSGLFKLNVHTGKLTRVSEESWVGAMSYDWQGTARLAYLQPASSDIRSFMYLPAKNGRWTKMDKTWSSAIPGSLGISAANYFGERSFPLGFGSDPKVLYYASNVGRDTYGVYAFDVETKRRTPLAIEDPHVDLVSLEPTFPSKSLVFDESRRLLAGVRTHGVAPLTVWIDPELASVQRALDRKFPRRTVEIREWDDARRRFLLKITGGNDPGRYYVFNRPDDLLIEFLRRAPWLKTEDFNDSKPFEFDAPGGMHLTGYLTFPRKPRLNPPPLLVYLSAGFPPEPEAEFNRDVQILADMGFVVARINHRGSGGFGRKHRDALYESVDRVPIDDVRATIDWIATHHKIDRGRIAMMGEGFGGFLALRALQLHPDLFRCAVALNAPLDLGRWLRRPVEEAVAEPTSTSGPDEDEENEIAKRERFIRDPIDADNKETDSRPAVDFQRETLRAFVERSAGELSAISVLRNAEKLTAPVFLIVDPYKNEEIGIQNNHLRSQLKRLDRAPDYLEVKEDFALNLPAARARAFRQIEEFFNLNLYDYNVKLGPTKEVK